MKSGDILTNEIDIKTDWAGYHGGPSVNCSAEFKEREFEISNEPGGRTSDGKVVRKRAVGVGRYLEKKFKTVTRHFTLPSNFVFRCFIGEYAPLYLLTEFREVSEDVFVYEKQRYRAIYSENFRVDGTVYLHPIDIHNNTELFPTKEYKSKIFSKEMAREYLKANSIIPAKELRLVLEYLVVQTKSHKKIYTTSSRFVQLAKQDLDGKKLTVLAWVNRNGHLARVNMIYLCESTSK